MGPVRDSRRDRPDHVHRLARAANDSAGRLARRRPARRGRRPARRGDGRRLVRRPTPPGRGVPRPPPGLRDEDAVRLVYEEVCLRQEDGEEGVSGEVLGRFPQYRSRLALLFDCNRLMRPPTAIDFPEPGDHLGDFRLLAEIGRGRVGRTFLASQQSLADRLMVLKVTPLGHEEHLSLARLQHMHIVPLYFEQAFPDRGLRVLGMPYPRGRDLARVLDALRDVPGPAAGGGPDPRRPGPLGRGPADRVPGRRAVPRDTWRKRPYVHGRLLARRPAWPTRSSTPTTGASSTST